MQGSEKMDVLNQKRRQAALFLLILFLALFLPGRILTPQIMNQLDLSSGRNGVIPKILSEPRNSIDLLVVGDSESYTSIDPRILKRDYGIRSYAAGQAGATIGESYEILKKCLSCQRPGIILYESNSLFRTQPDPNQTGTALSSLLERVFPLIKYHSAWKSPFIAKYIKTYKGFRIDTRVKAYKGGNYMEKGKDTHQDAVIGQANLYYLNKMKTLAEENGARFMMYSAPSPRNYDYSKHLALTQLAEKEGIEYVDMNVHNKELKMDWSLDTRDRGDHLNVYGARRATRFMGAYLAANGQMAQLQARQTAKDAVSVKKPDRGKWLSYEKKIQQTLVKE
jgi:hypothetical protein